MVKVFRNMRWKWISSGGAKKYFFYALGEVLLVVIGILIALSINNWNNEKELRKSEKRIYTNILKRIQQDREDIEGNIGYNTDHALEFQYATEIIEKNDRENIDTLKVILYKLYNYSDFDASETIYQNLVNSGDLKILKNDRIISGIQGLEEQYIYANRMETNHWEVILTYVGPGLIDNIHITDLKVERPDELYSFQFQNLLMAMLRIMEEKDQVYRDAIRQIDNISKLIEEDLKN